MLYYGYNCLQCHDAKLQKRNEMLKFFNISCRKVKIMLKKKLRISSELRETELQLIVGTVRKATQHAFGDESVDILFGCFKRDCEL